MATPRLTKERACELLNYNPDTGILVWNITRGSRAQRGDAAGSSDVNGYLCVRVDGWDYKVHRVAWLIHHGQWPDVIDHINGITSDNRLCNLRSSSQANNTKNSARHSDAAAPYKGIYRANEKWAACIFSDGVKHYLGVFATAEEAHAAYCGAARVLHKQFARVA